MRAGITVVAILAVAVAATIALVREGEEEALPLPPPDRDCAAIGNHDRNPDDRRVAPAPGGKALTPRVADGRVPFGFNDHAGLVGQVTIDEDATLLDAVGADLWRVAIDWRHVETAPGEIDLSAYDAVYCAALERGIRPVFVIAAAPEWAADDSRSCAADECLLPPATEHLAALREFAERVAIRYPRAAAIEAWNEPNLAAFWAEPDPDGYVEVLRAIYAGVKDGHPRMPVLGGSLSNTTRNAPAEGKVPGTDFAEAMYRAGAAGHMDALAFHPYPIEPLARADERFTDTMAEVRSVIAAQDPGRRIWITEVGLPTRSDASTDREQADSMLEVYRRLGRDGDVDAVLFHTLVDPDGRIQSAPGFGWLASDGDGGFVPKPVYCAFAARFGAPGPCDAHTIG